MSCFIGLPKGNPKRITFDCEFLCFVQTQIEEQLGCYFYKFEPQFYVNQSTGDYDTQDYYRFFKVGLSMCPYYSFVIIKARKTTTQDPFIGPIEVCLYRGCCIVRNLTINPVEIPSCSD
jgi:hypothetical protein